MERKFELLEHRADAYIASYGRTLQEAFENAGLALFEVMTDTRHVEPRIEDTIEVEGHDEQSLLYNWLEHLLVKFEVDGKLYSKFKILNIEKKGEKLKLKAKIFGEDFKPEKHLQKVGVKAVTYHLMEIKKEPQKVTLKFLLDL